MGGSDQWGNITAGIELIGRREQGQRARARVPAAHHRDRRQVRQERGRQRLARPGDAPARTSSTSSGSTPTTATWSGCSTSSPSCRLRRSRRCMAEQAADPGRRAAQRTLAPRRDRPGAREGHDRAGRRGQRHPLRRHRPPRRGRRGVRGPERGDADHRTAARRARRRRAAGGRAGGLRPRVVEERRPARHPGEGLRRQRREDRRRRADADHRRPAGGRVRDAAEGEEELRVAVGECAGQRGARSA